jgi:hypothetical protein
VQPPKVAWLGLSRWVLCSSYRSALRRSSCAGTGRGQPSRSPMLAAVAALLAAGVLVVHALVDFDWSYPS